MLRPVPCGPSTSNLGTENPRPSVKRDAGQLTGELLPPTDTPRGMKCPRGKLSLRAEKLFNFQRLAVAGELLTASNKRLVRCRCGHVKRCEPLAGGLQVRITRGSGMSLFNGGFFRVDDRLVRLGLFLAFGLHRRFEPFALIVQSA